jgi:hypothetical protein
MSPTQQANYWNSLSPANQAIVSAAGINYTAPINNGSAPATQKTYTFMNPATGKSQTLTQDQYNKLSPSFVQ